MKAYAALALVSALSIHAAPFGIFERIFPASITHDVATRQDASTGGTTGGSTGGGSTLNQGAVKLIESLEGFRANFYTIGGDKTIGFGHDCTQRQDCQSIKAPLSQQQGEQLLLKPTRI